MGALDDTILADAALPYDDFGQTATYTPHGGVARSIQILVHRREMGQRGGAARRILLVKIRNHATLGCLARSINWGGDTITTPFDTGDTAEAFRVHKPEEDLLHEEGEVWVELW